MHDALEDLQHAVDVMGCKTFYRIIFLKLHMREIQFPVEPANSSRHLQQSLTLQLQCPRVLHREAHSVFCFNMD